MIKLHFYWIVLSLSITSFTAAGQDTLLVDDHLQPMKVGRYIRYFKTPDSITVDSAARIFADPEATFNRLDEPHLGIVEDDFWFSLLVKNTSEKEQRFILELQHSHLVSVSFFESVKGKFEERGTMGMFHPFNSRPVKHRHFVLPITCQSGELIQVLVRIDHVNSLSAPFYLWDENSFHQRDYELNLSFGFFFGILFFCSLFALFCFFMVRQTVFLWYFCYVATAFLYLFYDIGAAFQFLYPNITHIDGPLGIQLPVLMFIFLIRFSQSFLKTKENHKRIHLTLNILILFFISTILIVHQFLFDLGLWFLPSLFLVMFIGLLTLIYTGIVSLRKNTTSAILYLAATGSVISSGLYHILAQSLGLLSPEFNPLFIGILVEVAFLSSALILQYGEVQRERSRLKNELVEQQNRMFQQYIEGIEKERNRIASDLHDNIGSKLSHIKQTYFTKETEEGTQRIASLIEDVRTLSHDLAPTIAKVSGLMPLVEKLIVEARASSSIDIKLQTFGFKEILPVESVVQVYRIIQESLNNITLHSKAKRADIQFFGYDKELVVTIEDDGVGFDPTAQSGFGINSMRTRVALLKGKIEINSRPGKGCMIVVQVPL